MVAEPTPGAREPPMAPPRAAGKTATRCYSPGRSSLRPAAAVLPRDDSQQAAELRQAFIKHLPRRVDGVQRRVQRLVRGVFDINALTLTVQEAGSLAGAAGRYGLVDVSERLFALEQVLRHWADQPADAGGEMRARVAELAQKLAEAPAGPARETTVEQLHVAAAEPGDAFPRHATPPPELWRRFSEREVTPLTSATAPAPAVETPPEPVTVVIGDPEPSIVSATSMAAFDGLGAPPPAAASGRAPIHAPPSSTAPSPAVPAAAPLAPAPAPPPPVGGSTPAAASGTDAGSAAAPRTRRLYYLAELSPFARELTTKLLGLGYSVDRLDQVAELKEMLGSLAPDAILIDAGFQAELEPLGEFVKRIRQRNVGRLPLIAFTQSDELAVRVRFMRSGADHLISANLSAADAAQKVLECLGDDSGQPFKVMIVEDDRSQALFAESVLRKAGMEPLSIIDPLDTLEALERFKPDLVLMDLYMPNIDGMELTSIIREREEFISIPIVFLSGEQDSEKHFEALSAGGDDFLSKPIRPKHLISAVTNRARRARLLRERRRRNDPRDAETGLYDRSFVLDRLAGALAAEDRSERVGALAFLELDGGGALRERFGLRGVDLLMRQLGQILAGATQSEEWVARYGDVNLIQFAQRRSAEELRAAIAAVITRIRDTRFDVDGQRVELALSAGICPLLPELADPAAVLDGAERALVRARQQDGMDAVAIYAPERPTSELSEGERLVQELRQALATESFQLVFQPIVSLNATDEEQYEVLLRLRTEQGAVLGAATLIEAAENAGLLSDLDRFIVARGIGIIDERRRQARPVRLYINQSVASYADVQRLAWLKQSLDTRRLPADLLALEFQLPDVLARVKQAIVLFQQLKELRVRVVLDHFEHNLTALQLLSVLPVDAIKLAPKYTHGPQLAGLAEELRTLVRAAHDSQRAVMAARVENAQVAAALWSVGVDLIQGNFVQQPGTELGFDFSSASL